MLEETTNNIDSEADQYYAKFASKKTNSIALKMKNKLENVAIIAMYCHLRPPDAIAFPT